MESLFREDRRVAIVHSSRFGHSTKIAETVADVLFHNGVPADMQALTTATTPDPQRHHGLVMVTSVRYGHFSPGSFALIKKHRDWVESVPTLLMTVSLTARTPEKRDPAVHVYTRKFLEKTHWQPTQIEVVPGLLDYPSYNLFDRKAIQLIMSITGGETDPTAVIDFTEWDEVRAASQRFADTMLR
ncbi:MAG: menaquinone-dependent protoporphyrinogen IX dehydrogenase [Propionibacteriaceae bacterium]|jgi:menaquinone-dependent protoporphyrinogen oxidase|nr:menaquinone-dependent protoporphyrinogen IX dehydrogenase [Propionibacteriaceae bacterium]